ncbi:hypothetical protein THRCLA_09686 [Thraustotheca clavata]|uniref:Uncharacterized protein n=1 Tax=Thraustotheca clavata TaxID=74557 RepID=A0A1V9YVE9_9STRA|nr:hypothetical protein THRCLA_09686 [Thraustotheca clavata]
MFSAVSSGSVRAALAGVCQDLCKDEQFEPLDVYRRLAQEAKIVYDTEKTKERMKEHPLTADIARSHAELLEFDVETLDTHVDKERNTMTSANVVFDCRPCGTKKKQKTKERMEWSYDYERKYAGEPFGTTLTYSVRVAMGYGKKNTLLRIVLRFSGHYPASYYQKKDENEQNCDDHSDENSADENEEAGAEKDVNEESGAEIDEHDEHEESDDDEYEQDEDENHRDHEQEDQNENKESDDENQQLHVLGPDEKDWEYVEEFELHEDIFEAIQEWYGTERDLSPQDLLTYLLAFPFTEDEYMVDDRVFDIVFNSESDGEEEE